MHTFKPSTEESETRRSEFEVRLVYRVRSTTVMFAEKQCLKKSRRRRRALGFLTSFLNQYVSTKQ